MNVCSKQVEILLVEDNPGDVGLVRESLAEGMMLNHLHVASDGIEAMNFLRGQDRHAEAPCPDLILLDLNLPRMNGREVLQQIKSDPLLQAIPVVILTSSKEEEDISKAYRNHANCYITKPAGFDSFLKVVRSIEDFWFSVAKLPCRCEASGAEGRSGLSS